MDTYSIGFSIGTIGFIVIYAFFIKNLMDVLLEVQPENRQLPPGLPWILLINFLPTFIQEALNFGWLGYQYYQVVGIATKVISGFVAIFQFYLYINISNSVALEYDNREIYYEHKPTFLAGIWLAIAYASTFLLNLFSVVYLSIFTILGYFVAFIVYWVQISRTKKKLSNTSIKIDGIDEDSIFKGL